MVVAVAAAFDLNCLFVVVLNIYPIYRQPFCSLDYVFTGVCQLMTGFKDVGFNLFLTFQIGRFLLYVFRCTMLFGYGAELMRLNYLRWYWVMALCLSWRLSIQRLCLSCLCDIKITKLFISIRFNVYTKACIHTRQK